MELFALLDGIMYASSMLMFVFLQRLTEVRRKGSSERYFVSISNWANPSSKQPSKPPMCGAE